jgi:aspartyl-tRNA(Asn)/glutamyl-tRNA(Gln) amidotransferase subunit A
MESQIKKIHQQLVSKQITCTALVQEKLNLLKQNTHNTVNSLLENIALEKAAQVDAKIAKGEPIGLLEGIPFGIKDVYMVQGTITTASSELLKNYKSPYTATSIQKLLDAGAIPLVKENCDSFGHGSSSENTIFGAVKNAVNPDLVGGGSSGGSAVNVALDYTVFSIGGDGTHRGILAMSKEIEKRGLKIILAGIPKTIDNDIPILQDRKTYPVTFRSCWF